MIDFTYGINPLAIAFAHVLNLDPLGAENVNTYAHYDGRERGIRLEVLHPKLYTTLVIGWAEHRSCEDLIIQVEEHDGRRRPGQGFTFSCETAAETERYAPNDLHDAAQYVRFRIEEFLKGENFQIAEFLKNEGENHAS